VTNQSGVARGLFGEDFVLAAHARIAGGLADGGAIIDAFYYCPHHPQGSVPEYRRACDCRKPQPGLMRKAASELGLALDRSFVVGDRLHDVEVGPTIGAPAVLVRTGYGCAHEAAARAHGAAIADNLVDAVAWILRQS
jgi:D-glycero-D-manno-heptose 1,7-bisphosphate phosphatase